jgi:hypothetical protein
MNKQKGSIFDINIEKNQYKREKIQNNEHELMGTDKNKEYDNNEICQICFDDMSTKENPLLKLCKCKNWIHYECLKLYINTKIKISENEKFTVKTYICRKFNCDVCLASYPLRFKIKEFNKVYKLIDYNIAPELNHIVLESLDYIYNGMNEKIVHVVQLIDNKIFIGRSLQNDIIDHHTSVSRNHAVLKFNRENGDLTIENRSKTLCFRVGKSLITSRLVEKIETKGE